MRGRAVSKNIQLDVTIQRPLPDVVVCDPMRLRQIILNLVSNAIKFTPAAGHVELTLRSEMSAHQYRVVVSVRDTGPGLTAEQISRLFHSFTQAEPGTARQYGGSGMGLAISKRRALLLGGDVTVSSTPGMGSEFTASVLWDLPAIDVSRSAFMRPPGDGDEHTVRTYSDGCADAWYVYQFFVIGMTSIRFLIPSAEMDA
jgi:signal transduction histidine kinase